MTLNVMAVTAKEAFWKEHQDSLIRIRSQLSSHGKSSPVYRKSPLSQGRKTQPGRIQGHPPYGKYRRLTPPYLSKVDKGPNSLPLRGNKYEVVPPVKPKPAFVRSVPDYDSWGEESDDEDEDDFDSRNRGQYKPKPYPQPSPVMLGAPFAMYYPPPPKDAKRSKHRKDRRVHAALSYKDMYHNNLPQHSLSQAKSKKIKHHKTQRPMPVFGGFMPMVHMMMPLDESKYKYIYGEEDSSEDDMNILKYMKKHPLFGEDLVSDLITELLEEEILPDTLMEAFNEYDRWAYNHPAYLPTLYACEDVVNAGVLELVKDIVREVSTELAQDYLDEKKLQRDPLEDFLSSLLTEAVDLGLRDVVRQTIMELAQEYLLNESANSIYDEVFLEELKKAVPVVMEDLRFELIAEEFLDKEVIAPEVQEEAGGVATEVLQHFDHKITKQELKEVSKKASGQLADSLLMDYLLSVIARQGKLWTQDDHANRYLDGLILDVAMEQYFGIQKSKDKTLENKPLKKLHEKAFTEVALDVCLQQLTTSLDEDLADVDEFERGVNDDALRTISLSLS